jgi:hypothetical protein
LPGTTLPVTADAAGTDGNTAASARTAGNPGGSAANGRAAAACTAGASRVATPPDATAQISILSAAPAIASNFAVPGLPLGRGRVDALARSRPGPRPGKRRARPARSARAEVRLARTPETGAINPAALHQRMTRAPFPCMTASTSATLTIDVSPGVVIASAPCAAPYSTAACGPLPSMKA